MSNHYFIGIKIPAAAAQSLASQRDAWNLSSHKRYPRAEDLHITLLFLGSDPYGEIDGVAEALGTISQSSFELHITGASFFGLSERPRVVYAAIGESTELAELQEKVRETLKDFRLSPDTKPFVPHITLANKWAGKELWSGIPAVGPESFIANEFSLFRIDPGGSPRYIALKTYQLKDGV